MLKDGADINLIKGNQIPLIIAVKNGDIAMVRLLIAHGADVNLTDAMGNTAMIYAKVGADAKLIEILKNAGAKNPFN
jgi:ankyrin repeat protein